ncbi:hypothetical protein HH214_10460 [Mucilaginibacter robiniae]|uniref:Uncharacterized protein n=1 Tax=Mucilaginibacter robiniae TaxID=2728022 RepID=A0A7L5DZ30_9SPHI|nr:hypothetical protein [Mucilaginibacter robiniae]QJD96255.1 hypothetical protein HH214_10460 [Mucilaginibacter robiniae]
MLNKKIHSLVLQRKLGQFEDFEIIYDSSASTVVGGLAACDKLSDCGTFTGSCDSLNKCGTFTEQQAS